MTIKYKEIQEIRREPESVICNKCGRVHGEDDVLHESPFAHLSHTFGYGSLRDNDTITFDLCEECLMEFAGTFKVKAPYSVWGVYDDVATDPETPGPV